MTPHKIIWQEGMLLRPQHFQQHDRHQEYQLRTRALRLHQHAWGFFELELDRAFLAMGKLVINRASGILPDGTLFEVGPDSPPLALDIPASSRDSAVYLALPVTSGDHFESRRADQPNVLARYVSSEIEVLDSNAGETTSGILSGGRLDLQLLLGESPAQAGFVRLQLCRIEQVGADGNVQLDAGFVPSVLHLAASAALQAALKELIGLVGHRADRLAARIASSGHLGSSEVGELLMLQLLNRCEPRLRHCLHSSQLHPERLYGELLGLLGELSSYAAGERRPRLDLQYQHQDLAASFTPLLDGLRQLLSMVLEQHAVELPLQTRQYGIQVAPLLDHSLLAQAAFVLVAGADCETEELRQRLPAQLKLGPVERIRQLVNLHLPGIRLRALPVAPRQLPFHSGKCYFALELDSAELALLERSGGFAFHLSGDCPGLELKLWAIRE